MALVESAIRHCRYLERAVEAAGLGERRPWSTRARRPGPTASAPRPRDGPGARGAAGPVRVRRAAAARGRERSSPGRAPSRRRRRRTAARPRSSSGLGAAEVVRVEPVPGRRASTRCTSSARSRPRRTGSRGGRGWRRSGRSSAPGLRRSSASNFRAERPFGAESAAPAASVGAEMDRLRHREPEGRGREDHHRRQRGRLHRRGRLRDPGGRRRPAGQRHRRPRRGARRRARALRRAGRRRRRRRTRCARPPIEHLSILASTPDLAGANMELPRLPGSENRLRDALAPIRDALRVRAARLPAVARPADHQRAGRRRPRDRPRPDGVLRARGPRRPARHAVARPARAQPAADGRRACC